MFVSFFLCLASKQSWKPDLTVGSQPVAHHGMRVGANSHTPNACEAVCWTWSWALHCSRCAVASHGCPQAVRDKKFCADLIKTMSCPNRPPKKQTANQSSNRKARRICPKIFGLACFMPYPHQKNIVSQLTTPASW